MSPLVSNGGAAAARGRPWGADTSVLRAYFRRPSRLPRIPAIVTVLALVALLLTAGVGSAAQDTNRIVDATEYDGTVEIVFDEPVSDVTVDAARVGGQPDESLVAEAAVDPDDARRATVSLNRDVRTGVELSLDVTYTSVDGTETEETIYPRTTTATIRDDDANRPTEVRRGEAVAFVANESDTVVELGDIAATTGPNSTVYTYDGNLENGTHEVRFESGSTTSLEVEEFDISASTTGNITVEDHLEVDVDTTHGGPAVARLYRTNGAHVDTIGAVNTDSARTTTFNFSHQCPGDYYVNVTDNATGTRAQTDPIHVIDYRSYLAFEDVVDVRTGEVGDVVTIPLELYGASQATIVVGSREDGYYATANITDGDANGVVTVEFNTFLAGSNTTPVGVVDEDDSVVTVEQGGEFTNWNGPGLGGELLDDGQYRFRGNANGCGSIPFYEGDADLHGTLSLQPRSVNDVDVWSLPGLTDVHRLDADTVTTNSPANETQTERVTTGNYLVLSVNASGLQGAIDHWNRDEQNVTQTLVDENDAASVLDGQDRFSNGSAAQFADGQLDLRLTRTGAEESDGGPRLRANESNTHVIADGANDTYYFVVDTSAVEHADRTPLKNGAWYRLNFSVESDRKLSDDLAAEGRSANETFYLAAPNATFGTAGDDELDLSAGDSQTITGTTTLPPRSNLTVVVRAVANDHTRRLDARIRQNGTFVTSANLGEFDGDRFTASVRYKNVTLDTVRGQVGDVTTPENASGATTPDKWTQPTTTTDASDSVEGTASEDSDGGGATNDSGAGTEAVTPATGPGFGFVVVPIAIAVVALAGRRRRPRE